MTFSPLTNTTIPTNGRYNTRKYKVSGFTVHHQGGVNAHGEASNPNREVSANYWISNDGTIIGNIPEEYRAWTTGSGSYPAGAESDHRNITAEVSNSPEGVRNGTWAISAAAKASLEKLIGDVFRRYRLGTVKRAANGGVAVHQDFVPTTCPGPYIMNNLGDIIANAEAHRNGGNSTPSPSPVEPTVWVRASNLKGAPLVPQGPLMARIQQALKNRGRYSGPVDGIAGVNTFKGIQQTAKIGGGYAGPVDGLLAINSAYGVQRYAARWGDYVGPIDGDPRWNSWENFALGLERP